jgi:hypothetical protein
MRSPHGAAQPVRRGRPLPAGVRSDMQALFGVDLSEVRVHDDGQAARLGAAAFAHGSDIHVASRALDPAAPAGRFLLAHELAHVLQQRAGRLPADAARSAGLVQQPALEREATTLGERVAAGESVRVPGAPRSADGASVTPALQGYVLHNSATATAGKVKNFASTTSFAAQSERGGSFMEAATNAPRIRYRAQSQIRISKNGKMAIEDSDLSHRQPKFFYATPSIVKESNKKLGKVGSAFELKTDAAETLTFKFGGTKRSLVLVHARNTKQDNEGLNVTIAQQCDATVKEVIGYGRYVEADLRRPPRNFPANQGARTTLYEGVIQYYVADELSGGNLSANIDLEHHADNLEAEQESIATAYGTAMHTHQAGPANANLDKAARQMRVNEYADPGVGEGYVTYKLGVTDTVANQLRDNYHGRIVNAPSNANMWGYHWGGVVAKDGSDVVTLENYSRAHEDALSDTGADRRAYFQMYGAGTQSWHTKWSALPAVKSFVNPVTMRVRAT